MSRIAGNQVAERHPRDQYATDPRWTMALLSRIGLREEVWEPACGDSSMANVIRSYGYRVVESDIIYGEDFLMSDRRANTIVTNPPYRLATEFIEHGLRQADSMLCLLLGWHLVAGGRARADRVWFATPPTKVIVIVDRMPPSQSAINGSGNSQFNHAWVVWDLLAEGKSTELTWTKAKL